MTSLNPQINALHAEFCKVAGRDTALIPQIERWWYEALKCDVTPQMVHDVMESRLKRDYSTSSMRLYCLSLRHCIGDDDRLAQFVDEAAALAAQARKRVYSHGKQSVLKAAGHESEPEEPPTRHISEVMEEMRKAAK